MNDREFSAVQLCQAEQEVPKKKTMMGAKERSTPKIGMRPCFFYSYTRSQKIQYRTQERERSSSCHGNLGGEGHTRTTV